MAFLLNKYRNQLIVWLMFMLGILAIGLMFYATPYGVGIYYDSFDYIEAARNFAKMGSLGAQSCNAFKPMTRYPPFYPLVLSSFEMINISAYRGARLVSALSLAFTVILSLLIVRRTTGSYSFGVIAAFLILSSGLTLSVFSWAMSEPVYIVLLLATLLSTSFFLDKQKLYILVLSSVLAGLTLLTRFVGITLIASVVLALLIDGRFQQRRKWKNILIFLIVSLFPMAIWLIRNELIAGNVTARTIGFHPPDQPEYATLISSVSRWFFPATIQTENLWFVVTVMAMGIAAILWIYFQLFKSHPRHLKPDLSFLLLSNIIIYIGILMISMTFFDNGTHPENRILIPIYVQLLLLLVTGFERMWRRSSVPGRIFVILMIGVLLIFQYRNLQENIHIQRADGQGYANSRWRQSETARVLSQMPTSLVYTNDKVAVYFSAHKSSCAIPSSNDLQALEAMRQNLRMDDGAVLVVFGKVSEEFMDLGVLTTGLRSTDFQDGRIYDFR